jgi:hypothetical protein
VIKNVINLRDRETFISVDIVEIYSSFISFILFKLKSKVVVDVDWGGFGGQDLIPTHRKSS